MSETGLSLPPEIKGKAHGKFKIELGNFVWLDSSLSAQNLNFRVKFWGEKGPGVILKAKGTQNEVVKNEAEYMIKCTQPIFINYLMDMGSISISLTDNLWRLLGTIKINIKLYLKRDTHASKGNLASNFGFSNIDVEGIFPILSSSDPPKKLGELELTIFSIFGETAGKISKQTEADIKPNFNEKYSENTKIADNRVALSLLPNTKPGEYNPSKIVPFKEEQESRETVKQEKQKVKVKAFEEPEHLKEDLKSDANLSIEWENLRAKGERLRKKLEASSKTSLIQEVIPSKIEPNSPLPTLSELQALTFPHDPTEFPQKAVLNKPISELSSITHLKLSIKTLTLFVFSKEANPYLDCSIPLPATESTRNDSFKISQKGKTDDIFNFNHESLHNIIISNGVFSRLASSLIKIKVFSNEKGKTVELGKAEVL